MDLEKLLQKKRKAIDDLNETVLCSACTDLANFYMKEERFNEAIKEFEILGQVYKAQKKMLDYATVNRGIGEAYMLMTNYEKAIEYQKIYLGLSKDQENELEEQRALATLGYTYLTKYIANKQNKNDIIMAHKYTMESLEVCERLVDVKKFDLVDMTARLYNNLGIIHEYQGHHDKSKELFNKAIVLCKANDVYESLHQAYNSFASLLDRRGEYNSAIQNYNLAIETAKKLKDEVSALYDCLVSKATILLKLGDLQASKKSLQKAYKLKLSTETREEVGKKLKTVVKLYRREKEMVSNSYSNVKLQKFYEKMGDGFSEMNCYERALEYYHKMLEIAKTTKINLFSCYHSIAVTYRDDEQYDKAVEFFEKEYALCDFKKGLDTLCEIADTKESGGCASKEIIKVYERAIQRCKEANSQREEGRMLGRLIGYLERSGISEKLGEYQRRFDESGFESSDSEDPLPENESNSECDVSLDNLTDDSENSESESPSKKRRNKTFQVKRNLRGETQLHRSCISGKLNVVKHLLEQGHPVNIRDNGGWLPLHDACISGHYDVVELLLDKGASVNDRGGTHCNGTTPLHDAAVNGHLKIMELLLDRGASALAKTDDGETPYHYLKKSSLELQFDEEQKTLCSKLLGRMSAILDKAGQSKEINTNIRNKAFVGGQRDQPKRRRRSGPDVIEDGDSIRERRTIRTIEKNSSKDENVGFSPGRRSLPKKQATNEYKMVMDNLRKKPCDISSSGKTETTTSKRSAYVMDEENRDEDWLEDDMKDTRTNKKRKMGFLDRLINSSKTRAEGQPLKQFDSFESVVLKSSKSSNRSSAKSPDKSRRLDSNERSDGIVEELDKQTVFDTNLIDYENDFVEPQDPRRKQQSSLLDAGFMRRRSSSEMPKRNASLKFQKFYEKMGDRFSKINCYEMALEFYHKMLEIAETTKINLSSCYYSIAVTYRDDKHYDKAVEFFEKEYALCDFKKGLDTLCEIADTKESGGCASTEIIKVYERAIQRCKEANSQREEGRMLGRLISYLQRSGISEKLGEYQRRFDESGFESSDSEDPLPENESNSECDVSLDNLTDDSENSESESPSKKRRNKTFQVNRNLRGETQLHTSCISGKLNVVKHLLEQGHPVNIRDNGGWLPLHDACISGHYDVVELLLDKGASVNDRGGTHCNGTTPLHDAAVNGHLKIMELLLDRGASALAKTDEGETPYHYLKKSSLELQFDEEQKTLCSKLLGRMSAILDKAGQSKEINTNIRNKTFVSGQQDQPEQRSRSGPDVIEDGDSIRERRTRRTVENSSSEDENVGFSPGRRSLPKTQATNEYKMVMDNLRKKPCDISSSGKTETTTSKRSAYVMDEENRDEDWLEDDMKDMRTNKKRKMGFLDRLINSSKTRAEGQLLKRFDSFESVASKSSKSSNRSSAKSPDKSRRLDSNERSDGIVEELDEQTVFDTNLIDYDSENDFVEPQDPRRKQQSSLLDAGFMRRRSSSEMPKRKGSFSQKKTLQPKITHFGSTTPTKMSQSSHRSSASPKKWSQPSPSKSVLIDDDPVLAMDVNIEGRLFRVTTRMSMKDTLTVKWLALEASRRYAKKEHVEPVLELTTQSGAELVDDDTIGTLFITDCQVVEVVAKVLKWNLPPITERYKEACLDMNSKPLDAICDKLDTLTVSLDMTDAGLNPTSMAPLCKCLLRESKLLELDLSNNFLTLDCVKLLAASLQTLENLTKLNLSCTNLHSEEIRFLSNTFSNSPVNILTKMHSLNLSRNFIGDESLQDLALITRHLSLKELDLSFLNFTEGVFEKSYNRNCVFSLENIEWLNLSGNGFGNDALGEILSRVNGNRLSWLDVGNNEASEGLATLLIDCLSKGASRFNFEYLNLSRCPVTDAEVFSLLRYCDNLKTLDLSYTNITSITLRIILETKFIKNIIFLGCPHIHKYSEDIDDN